MDSSLMKAVMQHGFGGPEVLQLAQVARPVPIPTEVLVRVHAAGINPVDWKSRAGGGMAGMFGAPPFILGWDVSGVVEEVGFGVTTLRPGDEVYGMPWFPRPAGAYAEFVTAPARQFARKPATITHEQAAAVPLAALTAWQALVDTAHPQPGQRVLVHAAGGGVGHFAVQLAKHLGAYVIGTSRSSGHDWLKSIGADELIDYSAVRFENAVADVDIVIDLVGDEHDATSTRSLTVLRHGGILVAVPGGVSPELAAAAESAGVRTSPFLVEPDGTALTQIGALIDAGDVVVVVEDVFDLADAAQSHTRENPDAPAASSYFTSPPDLQKCQPGSCRSLTARSRSFTMPDQPEAFYEIRRYQARPGRRAEWCATWKTSSSPSNNPKA